MCLLKILLLLARHATVVVVSRRLSVHYPCPMVISRKLRKTGQELLWDTIGKLALLILATVLRQG